MNCLFINLHEPTENSGGIESVTGNLCNFFSTSLAIKPYCLWRLKGKPSNVRYPFIQSISLENMSDNDILCKIKEWDINIIIVQSYDEMMPRLRKIIQDSNLFIKLIYVLHSSPGWELHTLKWNNMKRMAVKQGLRGLIKLIGYPLFFIYFQYKTRKTYNRNYQLSDKIVLLSRNFINEYSKLIKIADPSKLTAIPNPCRYLDNYNETAKYTKQNTVLIVSRFIECHKKLLTALKIWKIIEEDTSLKDWNLVIVGSGDDEKLYREYIETNGLKRVKMYEAQKPDKFYMTASVFMMTSALEGFPLTLVEAQSFRCVPIAFNSFTALSNIIEDNYNGIIVPANDITEYVNKLKKLITDNNYRNSLSENTTTNINRFSILDIGNQWIALFNELMQLGK